MPALEHLSERKVKVLLCGYGHLGLGLLQGLLASEDYCEMVGVFRWSSRPDSMNFWDAEEALFQQTVHQAGLEDIECPGMNSYEFTVILAQLQPDVVLIGSWGEIIKPHLIEYPGIVLLNCHPSKLPAHRGANPYASVILNQEAETGVTFHRIVKKLDAGAVVLQKIIPLEGDESGALVREKCSIAAKEMVHELLIRLKAHVIHGKPLKETIQDESQKSYFPQLKAEDALIHWDRSPEDLFRQMRALYPWMACYSRVNRWINILFLDPGFQDRKPDHFSGKPPGTILSLQNGVLQIASSDPKQVLAVSVFQLIYQQYALPLWLGSLLSFLLLYPGKKLN